LDFSLRMQHICLSSLPLLRENTACFEVLTQVAQWWETSKTNDCSSFIYTASKLMMTEIIKYYSKTIQKHTFPHWSLLQPPM
jgi:hypothetical protein